MISADSLNHFESDGSKKINGLAGEPVLPVEAKEIKGLRYVQVMQAVNDVLHQHGSPLFHKAISIAKDLDKRL